MPDFDFRVQNIVASASLNVKINLEKIVDVGEGVEYEPEQFPGLVYRIKKPKSSALIFSSGKIVCTGAKTLKDVKKVFEKVSNLIKKSGVNLEKNYKIEIENIVASAKLDSRLNLEKIALTLGDSEYEPEQFPGLVYRIKKPRVTFLLFSSGKIVCTGAKTLKDSKEGIRKIYSKLKSINALIKE